MASFVKQNSFLKRAAKRHPGWFTVGSGVGLLQPPRWDYGIVVSSFQIYNLF